MDRKVVDAISAIMDFKYDEKAPHTLAQAGFNTVEQEEAVVTGFVMLVDPAFAKKLAELSEAMHDADMGSSALPHIAFRAAQLGGISLCGVEDGETGFSAKRGTMADYDRIVQKAENSDRIVSDISEVEITPFDIVLRVAGNEEGICESVYSRDEFVRIANAPFEKHKDIPKP